jgi:ferritin-like metal-binding protein YciE
MRNVEDLLCTWLQDIYSAERLLLRSLDGLSEASACGVLRDALVRHRDQTAGQIDRLDRVFEIIGRRSRGGHCGAISGVIDETGTVIRRIEAGHVRDVGIIAATKSATQYEIARYSLLAVWAERLGEAEVASLLRLTLDEKKAFHARLEKIAASSVDRAALAA